MFLLYRLNTSLWFTAEQENTVLNETAVSEESTLVKSPVSQKRVRRSSRLSSRTSVSLTDVASKEVAAVNKGNSRNKSASSLSTTEPIMEEPDEEPDAGSSKKTLRRSMRRSILTADRNPDVIPTPDKEQTSTSKEIPQVEDDAKQKLSTPMSSRRRSTRRSLTVAESTPQSTRKTRRSVVSETIPEAATESDTEAKTSGKAESQSPARVPVQSSVLLERPTSLCPPTEAEAEPSSTQQVLEENSDSSDDVFLADKENIQPRLPTRTPKNIRNKSFGGFR